MTGANEYARQLIHIGAGFLAFALRRLGPLPLIGVALAGCVFNAWILPRVGGRRLWRPREVASDRAVGIELYPVSVLLLLTLFFQRPEVAAAGWGLLAFGDGFAALVGRRWGWRRLPWNPEKSWAGLAAYALIGTIGVVTLVSWTVPGRYDGSFLWAVAGAVSVVAALLESAPQRLDDNLGVPLLASLLLLCLLWTEEGWSVLAEADSLRALARGLLVNLVLAMVGFLLGTLSAGGAALGCLLGVAVFAFQGWRGYLVLLVFFALGAIATRLGYERKARHRIAQERGGRRGAANVLANGAVAAVCAMLAALTPFSSIFTLAFVGSLAAAAADTVESEIGQLWRGRTVLITSLRRVEPGTDGGISVVGSLAGLAAAGLTVATGWACQLYGADRILILTFLALAATMLESVVGATLERAGLLDNHGVNVVNTLLGALLGALAGLVGQS